MHNWPPASPATNARSKTSQACAIAPTAASACSEPPWPRARAARSLTTTTPERARRRSAITRSRRSRRIRRHRLPSRAIRRSPRAATRLRSPAIRPAYDEPLAMPDLPDPSAAIAAAHLRAEDEADASQPAPLYEPGPATRSGRAGLLVGLGVVLLVAAGAGGWWFMTSTPESIPNLTPAASAPARPPSSRHPRSPTRRRRRRARVDSRPRPMPPQRRRLPSCRRFRRRRQSPSHPQRRPATKKRSAWRRRSGARRQRRTRPTATPRRWPISRQLHRAPPPTLRAGVPRMRSAPRPPLPPRRSRRAAAPEAADCSEICASQGFFAEQICRSRECAAPEHAGEALCKELKDINDRRRNLQN